MDKRSSYYEAAYGYQRTWNDRWIVNLDEQAVICRIVELYVEARNVYTVRQRLWDEGYRNRAGNRISHELINKVLERRASPPL